MDYSVVKKAVLGCPELGGLEQDTLAKLFWMGAEKLFTPGTFVFRQGDDLNGAFYLLINGTINVWIDGALVAEVSEPTLIGEGAFTTVSHKRTASLQVGAGPVAMLEFRPSEEMVQGQLKPLFAEVAWDRWLEASRMTPG
jgi:hypothetical protein